VWLHQQIDTDCLGGYDGPQLLQLLCPVTGRSETQSILYARTANLHEFWAFILVASSEKLLQRDLESESYSAHGCDQITGTAFALKTINLAENLL
jgi:hypothetical protein